MNDFYNVEQTSIKTGFSERYIRERLNDGSLKGFKTGRKWFILHADLLEFIKSENTALDLPEKKK